MSSWRQAVVPPESSLRDTIQAMDASGLQAAIVLDSADRLLGVVTDGDVRRTLLAGKGLDVAVTEVMNANPKSARAPISRAEAVNQMRMLDIAHLPIVDANGRMVDLHILRDFDEDGSDTWVVIKAGGFGKRLAPLTDKIPKPLLPVDGKPLLERIIESLVSQGLTRIFLSVNYRAEMIRAHCGDGSKWNAQISYLEEDGVPRGTAGALALLPGRPRRQLLVMNGDILTDLDYRALMNFHQKQRTVATMCVREHKTQIQYGVVQFDGPYVSSLVEKPYHSCFINAGIYVFDPNALDHVPANGYFDMPTLLNRLVESSQRLAVFPLREFWLDIGHHSDLERAHTEVRRLRSYSGRAANGAASDTVTPVRFGSSSSNIEPLAVNGR